MRSRISFFNPGLFRKNMLRFWPVWAAYAGIWLLGFGGVWQSLSRYSRLSTLADAIVGAGWLMGILLGCSFGLIAAMCVFSYLHTAKSANFFHALPVDRLELFGTGLISGLAFVMIPNLIFYVLGMIWCAIFTVAGPWESFLILTMWLLELTTQYIFYFGAAVFCALLTGHILVMPCLYVAMNFCVPVAEWMLRGLCQELVWGFEYGSVQLHWLSPLYHEMTVADMPDPVQNGQLLFRVDGYHLLICAVGVGLIFLAWQLYKRRQLEAAGDVIAVSWLRPVFKYGVGLYGAMPLGIVIYFVLFQSLGGYSDSMFLFVGLCFSLLLGGLICYFTAAMLLEKSFKVMKKHGHGYLVLAVVLLVVLVGLRVDVLGLEIWTPDAEEVSGVRVWGNGSTINSSDPAIIQQVIDTHKFLLTYQDELKDLGDEYSYRYRHYTVVLVNGIPTMIPDDKYDIDYGQDGLYIKPLVPTEDFVSGKVVTQSADREIYNRSIIEETNTTIQIRYTMKNGYRVQRSYRIPISTENKRDPLRTALSNLSELQLGSNMGLTQSFERVDSMTLEFGVAYGLMEKKVVDSGADRQMVMNALLADYRAGNLAGTQEQLLEDREYYDNYTGWRLEYQLVTRVSENGSKYDETVYYSANLPRSAVHTLSALRSLGILTESEYLVVAD